MAGWIEELTRNMSAGVAHAFLLHLNVADYVMPASDGNAYLTLKQYLREVLFHDDDRRLVIFYDRSGGITFGGSTPEKSEDMRILFAKLTKNKPQDMSLPRDPTTALPLIEQVLTMSEEEIKSLTGKILPKGSIAVVIGFAETVAPAGNISSMSDSDRTNIVTLARWARSSTIAKQHNLLMFLTVNAADIASHLRGATNDVVSIKMPLPNMEERRVFLEHLVWIFAHPVDKEKNPVELRFAEGVTPETIAHVSAGLSLRTLEDIIRLSVLDQRPLDASFIFEEKRKVIETMSGGLLRVVRPRWTFDDIGGLRQAKEELIQIADAMKFGNILDVPEGVLLMGPPGTAKSILAEAFAEAAGVPMLDLVTLRDKWVGSSEQRQELALTLIDELSPNIVRRDEAEAEDSLRGEGEYDGGVNARLRKREFEFFSDPRRRGRVLLFRITNRPDLMDPAALRAGRSDLRMPVLPTDADVPEITTCLMRSFARQLEEAGQKITWQLSGEEFARVTGKLKNFTGADIRAFLALAGQLAGRRGSTVVTVNDLENAAEDYIPSRDDRQHQAMSALALKFTTLKHLVPEEWRVKLDRAALEREIDDLRGQPQWKKKGIPTA